MTPERGVSRVAAGARLFDDGSEVWSGRYAEAVWPGPSVSFGVGGITGDLVRVQLDRPDYLHMAEVQVLAVPEPATVATMLAGLGLVGAAVRRRRRRD